VLEAGIYLALRDTTTASRRDVGATRYWRGVSDRRTALYVHDEDADTTRRYYRDKRTPGAIVGAVACHDWVGAFLWYRERGDHDHHRYCCKSTQRQMHVLVPGIAADGEHPARRLLGGRSSCEYKSAARDGTGGKFSMGEFAWQNSRNRHEHDRQNSQHDSAGVGKRTLAEQAYAGMFSVGSAKAPAGGAARRPVRRCNESPGRRRWTRARQRRRPSRQAAVPTSSGGLCDDYSGGWRPLLVTSDPHRVMQPGKDLRGLRGHQGGRRISTLRGSRTCQIT